MKKFKWFLFCLFLGLLIFKGICPDAINNWWLIFSPLLTIIGLTILRLLYWLFFEN